MSDIRVSDLAHSVDAAEEYFLAHYGVKGMKWGVRRYQNADGSLTDAGKKKLADRATGDYGKRDKFLKGKKIAKLYGVDELREARQKVMDADKLSEEFYNSHELQKKYKAKALDILKKEGYADKDIDIDDPKEQWWIWAGDWDQGSNSSFALFLKDRNVGIKEYEDNLRQAEKDYYDTCTKVVDDLLGQYSDYKVTPTGITANRSIVQGLEYNLYQEQSKRKHYGRWDL